MASEKVVVALTSIADKLVVPKPTSPDIVVPAPVICKIPSASPAPSIVPAIVVSVPAITNVESFVSLSNTIVVAVRLPFTVTEELSAPPVVSLSEVIVKAAT